MTDWKLLNEAHAALLDTVNGLGAGDWAKPTPCADWNVAQVLQHAVGDQLGFAAAITGGQGPTFNPFAPDGELTEDPVAFTASALALSAEAWASVAKDATEVAVPVPPNVLDAVTGVGACALDAAVHAWDIAVATGRPQPLSPWVASEILVAAKQIVEPLRAWGAYAPALEALEDDDEIAALLRYLGRDPRWAAAT